MSDEAGPDRPEDSLIARAQPLFLIGPPRSGTTVLAKILNAHPRILITNETAVFLQLEENIRKSRKGVTAGILYGKQYHQLWAEHLLANAKSLIESYYEKIAREQRRTKLSYWGEKHPHLAVCLDLLDGLYPDARYVYAIRDPRDSACSIAEMNKIPIRKAIDSWVRFSSRLEKFCRGMDPARIVRVSYEALVHDYQGEAQATFEKLGLPFGDQVKSFVEQQSSRDAHGSDVLEAEPIDFRATSHKRWQRDMTDAEHAYALQRMGYFLAQYGYVKDLPPTAEPPDEGPVTLGSPGDRIIKYRCNICGIENSGPLSALQREKPSCWDCGSSVRMRSLIHMLSLRLFGESLPLPEFPVRPGIRGIDLSGWAGYGNRLGHKLGYKNTFYHQSPRFDITKTSDFKFRDLDFLISSDVFEHVAPPVSRAFEGAFEVLKPGGSLILTVPFLTRIDSTIEHYPRLHRYSVEEKDGEFVLKNRTADGKKETYRDLKFHGGPGETLEMRVFSRKGLIEELEKAGFEDIKVHAEPALEYGIEWGYDFSLPISARRAERARFGSR